MLRGWDVQCPAFVPRKPAGLDRPFRDQVLHQLSQLFRSRRGRLHNRGKGGRGIRIDEIAALPLPHGRPGRPVADAVEFQRQPIGVATSSVTVAAACGR